MNYESLVVIVWRSLKFLITYMSLGSVRPFHYSPLRCAACRVCVCVCVCNCNCGRHASSAVRAKKCLPVWSGRRQHCQYVRPWLETNGPSESCKNKSTVSLLPLAVAAGTEYRHTHTWPRLASAASSLPSRELLRLDSNLFVLYLYLYVPAEGFQFHTFQPAASVNVIRLSRAFSSVSHSHCHTPPASQAKPASGNGKVRWLLIGLAPTWSDTYDVTCRINHHGLELRPFRRHTSTVGHHGRCCFCFCTHVKV